MRAEAAHVSPWQMEVHLNMANSTTPFEKVDLVKSFADRVSVSVWLPRDNEAAEMIVAILGPDRSLVQRARYRRSRTDHFVTQFFMISPDDDSILVSVDYDRDPGPLYALSKDPDVPWSPVLNQVVGIETTSVRRQVNMAFENTNEFENLFFLLPVPFPSDGPIDWPLDEIRGIRGVKLQQDEDGDSKEDYSFVLDRPSNDDLYLSLQFLNETRLPDKPVTDTLTRGKHIATTMGIIGQR